MGAPLPVVSSVGAKSNLTNVHVAYPEVVLQIEVYDPARLG